jgi:hypothetical protein
VPAAIPGSSQLRTLPTGCWLALHTVVAGAHFVTAGTLHVAPDGPGSEMPQAAGMTGLAHYSRCQASPVPLHCYFVHKTVAAKHFPAFDTHWVVPVRPGSGTYRVAGRTQAAAAAVGDCNCKHCADLTLGQHRRTAFRTQWLRRRRSDGKQWASCQTMRSWMAHPLLSPLWVAAAGCHVHAPIHFAQSCSHTLLPTQRFPQCFQTHRCICSGPSSRPTRSSHTCAVCCHPQLLLEDSVPLPLATLGRGRGHDRSLTHHHCERHKH